MTSWSLVFLGAIALATLTMAVVQVGIIVYAARLARRVGRLADQVEQDLKPLLDRLNEMSGEAARASSLAVAQVERADQLFAHFAAPIERFGIVTGLLTAVVGTGGCILEVVLYWPGPRNLWHERMLDPSKLSRYRDFEDDPEVDRVIVELRSRLIETFHQAGAAHLQIGKRYPYLDGLDPGTRGLLEAIKDHVDPHRLTNPGSLGL